MNKTLICLISEQIIQNLLFIKEFEDEDCNYVFITSDEMEQKKVSKTIQKSLNIKKIKILKTDYFNAESIVNDLNKYSWNINHEYIINGTGGTKLLSQIVFAYFSKFNNMEFYYLPINTNSIQMLHPKIIKKKLTDKANLTIDNIFEANGYDYNFNNTLYKPEMFTSDFYQKIINLKTPGENHSIKESYEPKVSYPDKQYYMGAWFEEYMFSMINNNMNMKNGSIYKGVKFYSKHSKTSNNVHEMDIAFVYNNKLYLVECKVYKNKLKGKNMTDPIFKLSAIQNMFGINTVSIVAILAPLTKDINQKQRLKTLCETNKIDKYWTLEDFKSNRVDDYFNSLKICSII